MSKEMASTGQVSQNSVGVRWEKLRSLSNQIYGHDNGKPQFFVCTDQWIVVGTLGAELLRFDWSQKLIQKYDPPPLDNATYGAVTCAFVDSKRIVAGYKNGYIVVWSLAGNVLLSIPPILVAPRPGTLVSDPEGHLHGSAITGISMIGGVVVSADNSGLVFEHYMVRLLMERRIRTKKLLGEYKPVVPTGVLAMETVVIGRGPTLLCVLTSQHFLVYSMGSPDYPAGVQLVLPRSNQNTDVSTGLSGSIAWRGPHTLALCWANSLKVLRLSWRKDSKLLRPQFECTAERAWLCDESIVKVDFITENIVHILTVTEQLLIFDLDSLQVIDKEEMQRKQLLHIDLFSETLRSGPNSVVADSYNGTVHTHGHSLIYMGKYEFHCGLFINWADKIMTCLNQSQPVEAVNLAIHYYKSESNLELVGLGEDHKDMVAASLPDIILTLIRYTLEMDIAHISRLLDACLDAIILTRIPLMEQVYELVEPYPDSEVLFLHKILSLAKTRTIRTLDPKIFRRIVEFLSEKQFWSDLTDVLLNLDSSTLDLHLAFAICKENDLVDVQIFLTSTALLDFVTPLDSGVDQRYKFLMESLCGRVYLTGEAMTQVVHTKASHDIYSALFMSKDYALVDKLLTDDPKQFFEAMDVAFEQSYLNEDNPEHMNRQQIIGVLKLVLQRHNELYIYFNVFLARNVAKYQQFIVMSGSELRRIFTLLCTLPSTSYPSKDDRELAILSLLSAHKLADFNETISLLTEARYYSVIEHLYATKGDFARLVETLMRQLSNDSLFDNFWPYSQLAMRNDPSVVRFYLENVSLLCERTPDALGEFVCDFNIHEIFGKLDGVDEVHKLRFLNSVATNGSKCGFTIPDSVVTTHVNLLAKLETSERVMDVLTTVYTQKNDVKLSEVVDNLLEHKHTNALVLLLCRHGRDTEAMIYLLDHIETYVDDVQVVDTYVKQGTELCTRLSYRDYEEGKKVWKSLLVRLVTLKLPVYTAIQELVNCSLALSDQGENGLATSVAGDVAESVGVKVLEDFYECIEQQKLLATVIKENFDGMSYKDVMMLVSERLRGWTLSIDGECEGCGQKICGLGLDATKLYGEWEQRQKGKLTTPSGDALVVFRCTHAYHLKCLMRFEKELRCTICMR